MEECNRLQVSKFQALELGVCSPVRCEVLGVMPGSEQDTKLPAKQEWRCGPAG